ncbi:MAG: hypothetical protein ACLTZT_11695 [Butyricimonas faecalis]
MVPFVSASGGGASLLGTNDPLYVIDGIPTVVSDNYINGQSDITNPLEAANYGRISTTAWKVHSHGIE